MTIWTFDRLYKKLIFLSSMYVHALNIMIVIDPTNCVVMWVIDLET